MAFPVQVALTITAPPDIGLPPDVLPFTATLSVEQKSIQRLLFSGTGSRQIDFGTIGGAGAQLVLVALEPGQGVQPITCRYNGGGSSGSKEVSPGGFELLVSPSPVAGITSLEIFYTATAAVKVWVLG
jgi:hypothetical protein